MKYKIKRFIIIKLLQFLFWIKEKICEDDIDRMAFNQDLVDEMIRLKINPEKLIRYLKRKYIKE